MTECIATLVRLKYDIITCDPATWGYSSQYPPDVLSDWAWRCAEDVEHIARARLTGRRAFSAACDYRAGKINIDNLWSRYSELVDLGQGGYWAACSAIYAAARDRPVHDVLHAVMARHPRVNSDAYYLRWRIYIGWLIEELIRYESR